MNNHIQSTFSLNITLGYGGNNRTEEELNNACSKHPFDPFGLSEIASSLFSGSSVSAAASSSFASNSDVCSDYHDQKRFFVASASEVRLCVNPPEKFWRANAYLITVFVPPHMVTSALEKHFSSNKVASGSSFWINPPSSVNFARDLLPKIHRDALKGCRIRGIVLTSIAATNGPAELLLLEVPKGRSMQDGILRGTNGTTIARDPDFGVLKILPISAIEFTHESEDDPETPYSEKKTGQHIGSSSISSKHSSTSALNTITPEIPSCPVCIHRIDPIRLGLPGPNVQQLCSKFCQSPSLNVCSLGADEETCRKQRLLVSTM